MIANSILEVLLNEGGALKPTCKIINDNGWLRDCGQPWNFQALALWVRNPHIAGEVEINSKNKSKDQKSLPSNEQYRIVLAIWDSVVDPSKLHQARKLLDENYRKLKGFTVEEPRLHFDRSDFL
ncbi:MAG: recombinase family protein [Bdellovibrionales bacterium]